MQTAFARAICAKKLFTAIRVRGGAARAELAIDRVI
jgi:hypothetical protein